MEYTTYASRLRYLDASEVDNAVVDYDGLAVRGPGSDKLGEVDGFIVDAQAGRLYYVVVDSGGWFRSRRFLLPVGHAALDADRTALHVDVAKDTLTKYPEFDADRFRQFSDEDLRIFETRMVEACCPAELSADASGGSAYDSRRHYVQPSWWNSAAPTKTRSAATEPDPATVAPSAAGYDHELVTGRESSAPNAGVVFDDASPHYAGRAQPGDVLGIETGGERTYVGDTADDEDRRRREALAAADDEPRQSER
jgi:hypothetical protein